MSSRVDELTEMLGDVYLWFTRNLKDREIISPAEQDPGLPALSFSLHTDPNGRSVCENACFNPEWLHPHENNPPIFTCECPSAHPAHGREVSSYFCMCICVVDSANNVGSPASLLARLNGPSQTWKIWIFSENDASLSSLVLRRIPPSRTSVSIWWH